MGDRVLTIAFARRGYSPSGGAESYLKRLAGGVADRGHKIVLFTTAEWPSTEWPFGDLVHVPADAPLRFANELERMRPAAKCDLLMSLERVWQCDVYRAGDGVHRAWLDRRAEFAPRLQRVSTMLNPKHLATLRLEQSLFGRRGAGRVIANSHFVKSEIVGIYDYPAAQIDIVPNGIPLEAFRCDDHQRAAERRRLNLAGHTIAVLFVGSGWERKGLRFALDAVDSCDVPNVRLLVAGRGNQAHFRSPAVEFLGELGDVRNAYAAADVLLLPTIYDPFSNACLEALACGLPVITTRANGFAEIMREGIDGSIIERPNDIAAMGAALQFWSDPEQRAATRALRLELASRYDISVNAERTLEILLQAAASAESTSGKMRNT